MLHLVMALPLTLESVQRYPILAVPLLTFAEKEGISKEEAMVSLSTERVLSEPDGSPVQDQVLRFSVLTKNQIDKQGPLGARLA